MNVKKQVSGAFVIKSKNRSAHAETERLNYEIKNSEGKKFKVYVYREITPIKSVLETFE